MMKRILAAAALVFVPAQGLALDINILGRVGYDSIKGEKEDDQPEPKAMTGYDLGVLAQVSFVDLTVASLYGGAGLSYVSVSRSQDGVDVSESLVTLPLELGVSFKALPLLTLQGAVGYDVGLSGSAEAKSDETTLKADVTSYGGVTLTARGMMSILPLLMAGLELQYTPTGTQETKDKDSGDKSKGDFTGYAIRLVAGVGI